MHRITSLGFAVLLAATSTMAVADTDHNHSGGTNGMQNGMSMGQGMGGMKKGMPMGQGMGGMKQGGCGGMMQMRQKMQAKVIQIQQEPDLAKRQAMMKEHMEKMQAMMMKRRQAMQAEMMKITNEPDADKRMAMLKAHMAKKGGMMNMQGGKGGMQGMMMDKSAKDQHTGSEHQH